MNVIYKINGEEVTAEEFRRHKMRRLLPSRPGDGSHRSAYSEGNPGKSLSMGCHPSQAGMMNAAIKAAGISGVEWDKRGKCIITSRRGRAKAMKVVGEMVSMGPLHDEDGGYGDG